MNTPFYGGIFSALVIEQSDHISALDNGTDPYAGYVAYKDDRAQKVVLLNTDYYSGHGSRSSREFSVWGIPATQAQVLRMTAPNSEAVATSDETARDTWPSIGGTSSSREGDTRKPTSPELYDR